MELSEPDPRVYTCGGDGVGALGRFVTGPGHRYSEERVAVEGMKCNLHASKLMMTEKKGEGATCWEGVRLGGRVGTIPLCLNGAIQRQGIAG